MTRDDILDAAVAAFHAGLPEGTATDDDLDGGIRDHFARSADRLARRPRARERMRPAMEDKLRTAGQYAAAIAAVDGSPVGPCYFDAGMSAAGVILGDTNLC